MKPRWKAFGLLTLALFVLMLVLFGYMGAMGYFELDREEVVETVDPEEGMELVVDNKDGNINIDTWNKNIIEIVGIKKTYFGENQFKHIHIKIEKTDVLKISVDKERNREWVWMDLKIHIPENMSVDRITANNGHVDVSGISGDFSIKVQNGKIDAEHVTGDISLSAANGKITLEYGTGNFTLNTDNGNIFASYVDMIISAESQYGWIHIHHTKEIGSVECSNGEIWVKNSEVLNSAKTENGLILVQVIDIAADGMDIRCNNGEIDITVPEDIRANYTIETDNGDIHFRGFGENGEKRVGGDTFGILNDGGPMIDIQMNNGDVFLRGE